MKSALVQGTRFELIALGNDSVAVDTVALPWQVETVVVKEIGQTGDEGLGFRV